MTVLLSLAMIQLSIFWYWYNFEKTLQDEKHSYISKLKRPFGNNFNQQVYSLPSFIRDYPFLSFNSLFSIEILCNHCNICKVITIVSLQSLSTLSCVLHKDESVWEPVSLYSNLLVFLPVEIFLTYQYETHSSGWRTKYHIWL